MVDVGLIITGADYVQALRLRRELIDELDQAMVDLDLVIMATVPGEAPAIDAGSKFATLDRPSLTMPFNVTGSPAMFGVLRLWRRWPAIVVADRRQALRRCSRIAPCPCI